jgi:hypothetical protein
MRGMGDAETYRFTFTRDPSELDRARRAWCRATGWTKRRVGLGSVMVACGAILVFLVVQQRRSTAGYGMDIVVAAAVLIWGLGALTGAWDTFRFRLQVKRYPVWTCGRTYLVSSSSLLIEAPGIETRLAWSALAQVVVLDDMVVLWPKDQPGWHYLPRRGLEHDDQWSDVVRLLTAGQEQNSATTQS